MGFLVRLESGQPRECGKACRRQCLEKLQHTYLIVSGSLDSAVTVGAFLRPLRNSEKEGMRLFLLVGAYPFLSPLRKRE